MAEPNYFDQFDAPAPQAAAPGPITLGTPRPKKPEIRQVGNQLGIVDDQGNFTPTYTAPPKPGDDGAKQIPATAAAGIQENLKTMRALDDAIKSVDARPGSIGPGTGFFGDTVTQYNDPGGTGTRASVGAVGAYKIHDLSGAAVSATEAPRFSPFVPTVTDRPEVAREKLKKFREALDAQIRESLDYYTEKNGYMPYQSEQSKAYLDGQEDGRLPDAEFQQELRRLIQTGDKQAVLDFAAQQGKHIPDMARLDEALGVRDASVPPPQDAPPPEDGGGGGFGHDLGVGVSGVLQGAGDIANAVSTPFVQGVNAVFGTDYNPDMGANLRSLAGTPQPQNDYENVAYAINRGGTAALGLSGIARNAARYAQGPVSAALTQFGSRPLSDMTAGSGAGTGAELARQAGGGPVSQAAAGFIGGGLTLPASNSLSSLLTRNPGPVSTALTRAGEQEGVTVNRAMADRGSEQRVTGVGKTMVGGKIMQHDMGKVSKQIEGRVERLGQGGTALDDGPAGQVVEHSAQRYIKTSGQRFGRIYDSLDREVGSVKVPATTALQRVDEVIGRLSEAGETHKAEISFLEGLKKDFSKNLSVGALRDMRTTLRKKISKGDLTYGPNEARVLSIMDAASDDIAAGLTAAGKGGAARRFKQIDGEYARRMDFIKNTVQKIVGKRDAHLAPGQIFANLKNMAAPKGDDAALARMIREMEPEEQADIAATFANALGKNGDGEFSTAVLVTRLEKMPRAAQVNLFGPDGAKSLDNLALLAKEHKRVSKALGGSPTGVANDWRSWVTNLLVGGGAGGVADGATTGLATAAGALAIKGGRDAISARALMSPKIQGWLKSAPRTNNPKAIDAHLERLKAIAVREPALAPDIQQIIKRAANENMTPRVAASQPDNADEHK